MAKPSIHDAKMQSLLVHPFVLVLQDADRNQFGIIFDSQAHMDEIGERLGDMIREGECLNLRAVHMASVSKDLLI